MLETQVCERKRLKAFKGSGFFNGVTEGFREPVGWKQRCIRCGLLVVQLRGAMERVS